MGVDEKAAKRAAKLAKRAAKLARRAAREFREQPASINTTPTTTATPPAPPTAAPTTKKKGLKKRTKKKRTKKRVAAAVTLEPWETPLKDQPAPKKQKTPAVIQPAAAWKQLGTQSIEARDAKRLEKLEQARRLRLLPPFEVFLKYLPHDCKPEQVSEFFQGCGPVVEPGPKLMHDLVTGRVIRGFVTFTTAEGMRAALSRDLEKLGKRVVSVTPATTSGTMQAAGTHTPGMFAECLRTMGVRARPDGVFVDGTFGRGGHSRKILEALGPNGTLHAFDMDPDAVAVGQQLAAEDSRFRMHHAPFGQMARILAAHAGGVDGILLDVGISSPQLDGGRGFRPEFDSPLDLRFDTSKGETALEYLLRVDRLTLADVIHKFGGEHVLVARRIADAIAIAKRADRLPTRTAAFAKLVSATKKWEYQAMHPAKMTFQALRIAINREFSELTEGLASAMTLLREGSKVAILTWKHSECAVVVGFFREHELAERCEPLRIWFDREIKTNPHLRVRRRVGLVVDKALRPSKAEVAENSRVRSAVLHAAAKGTGLVYVDLAAQAALALEWAPYAVDTAI